MSNPFGGQLPPGWEYRQVAQRRTHGHDIYMVWNEKGEVVTEAQFDGVLKARTHLTYIWERYHAEVGEDGR